MKRIYFAVLAFVVGMTFSIAGQAQQQRDEPDNTRVNQQDRGNNPPTADQQKNNQTDVQMTQQIRRSIVRDKSLSTYAHNIKIVTQHGMVTLRGPVRSEEEKSAIEAKATEVAGAKHVKNELNIAPEKNQQQSH